jgi:serine/threonine protein kinase
MRMIRHPYIVKLCEVLSTQQKIILVMEYIDGGDLFDYISNSLFIFRKQPRTKTFRRPVKIILSADDHGFGILP